MSRSCATSRVSEMRAVSVSISVAPPLTSTAVSTVSDLQDDVDASDVPAGEGDVLYDKLAESRFARADCRSLRATE